jgi:hypothetical protein
MYEQLRMPCHRQHVPPTPSPIKCSGTRLNPNPTSKCAIRLSGRSVLSWKKPWTLEKNCTTWIRSGKVRTRIKVVKTYWSYAMYRLWFIITGGTSWMIHWHWIVLRHSRYIDVSLYVYVLRVRCVERLSCQDATTSGRGASRMMYNRQCITCTEPLYGFLEGDMTLSGEDIIASK